MSLLAIASGDWHCYRFRAFDVDGSRLNNTLNAVEEIFRVAEKHNVPVLFTGDLFHTPKEVDNYTLIRTVDSFQTRKGKAMYAISGNHDQSEKNGWDYRSPTYLKMFWAFGNRFKLLDYAPLGIEDPFDDFFIQGIPYMNSEDEIKKAVDLYRPAARASKKFKILMMHGDVAGAKDNNGLELYDGKLFKHGVDKFFKEWDLVIYGHIHLPQRITKKVYMLGSPIQQISSDQGKRGYWEIYNDREPKFVGLAYPQFIHLKEGEKEDGFNYCIPFEKEAQIEDVDAGSFNLNVSRTKLARRYMKKIGIKSKVKRNELIKILNSIE